MPLNSKQRSELKARAHHLKPVVRLGQHGLSEAVVKETDLTLDHHELIKVHIQGDDRHERLNAARALCEQTQAELVGHIGKIYILYRERQEDVQS